MKLVKTKDGSFTFYSKEFDEHYQSLSGAEEEARKKYAEQSELDRFCKKDIRILDICFGIGYVNICDLFVDEFFGGSDFEDSGFGIQFSVGISYSITDNIVADFDYRTLCSEHDDSTGYHSLLTLGARYTF